MAIDFGKRMGFGMLRLPLLDQNDQKSIDKETLAKMIDMALEHGIRYFDTSYIYHDGESEKMVGELLTDRYPRDAFLVSSKLPINFINRAEEMEPIFQDQLNKTHLDHFDFYLIHNLGYDNYRKCNEFGTFEFLAQKKAEGRFREFGISFHDKAPFLDMVLTEHPEIDFVVAQINFIDWKNPAIMSKDIYEVCVKHNKPIVVMEGCKGGTLAVLPERAVKLMKDYNPDASIASWAYRFCRSLPGVRVVLVGNPKMEFFEDNLNTFENFVPLNDEEYKILDQVVDIINEDVVIPCTYCRYCTTKCPMNIPIPEYFALVNDANALTEASYTNVAHPQGVYYSSFKEQGFNWASACIKCGLCEKACPQHLPIRDHLENHVVREIEDVWMETLRFFAPEGENEE